MLKTKIRKNSQAVSAIGVMISLRINGQKDIPKRNMSTIKSMEPIIRLEKFISVILLRITTVQYDGLQTVNGFPLIRKIRQPVSIAHGFKKLGQLMNGVVRYPGRFQEIFKFPGRHEIFSFNPLVFLNRKTHLAVALYDHISQI